MTSFVMSALYATSIGRDRSRALWTMVSSVRLHHFKAVARALALSVVFPWAAMARAWGLASTRRPAAEAFVTLASIRRWLSRSTACAYSGDGRKRGTGAIAGRSACAFKVSAAFFGINSCAAHFASAVEVGCTKTRGRASWLSRCCISRECFA